MHARNPILQDLTVSGKSDSSCISSHRSALNDRTNDNSISMYHAAGHCQRGSFPQYGHASCGFRSARPPTPPSAPYPPLPSVAPSPYSPEQQGPVCLPLPPPQPVQQAPNYKFQYSQRFQCPVPVCTPLPPGPHHPPSHPSMPPAENNAQRCFSSPEPPPPPPKKRFSGGSNEREQRDNNVYNSARPENGNAANWQPSPPPQKWWQAAPPPAALPLPQQAETRAPENSARSLSQCYPDDDILQVWSGENCARSSRNGGRTSSDISKDGWRGPGSAGREYGCASDRSTGGRGRGDDTERDLDYYGPSASSGRGQRRGRTRSPLHEQGRGSHHQRRRDRDIRGRSGRGEVDRHNFAARAERGRSTNPPASRNHNQAKVRWSGDDVNKARGDSHNRGRRPSCHADGGGRRRRDEENDGKDVRRRAGKSCPPSTTKSRNQRVHAEADDEGGAAAARAASEEDEEEDVKLMDAKLAAITDQMMQLQVVKAADPADLDDKLYLSLEEYKAAVAAGEIKAYAGKKYNSADELYADGSAYNPTTRRWVKVACQNKNMASKTNEKLMAGMQKLQQSLTEISKLSQQRAELQTKKSEMMLKEKTARPTVTLSTPTAPNLLVFDTNMLMEHLDDAKCRIADIAGRRPDTSALVPSEVLRELDGLKQSSDESKSYCARKANRFLLDILERPPDSEDREFPVVRGQKATELYRFGEVSKECEKGPGTDFRGHAQLLGNTKRCQELLQSFPNVAGLKSDDGHHSRPAQLRGDDAILNCCLFFVQGVKTPRKVTLCTGDNNFLLRAKSNGLGTDNRTICTPGSCRMPLCPAPSKPSPFAAAYPKKR